MPSKSNKRLAADTTKSCISHGNTKSLNAATPRHRQEHTQHLRVTSGLLRLKRNMNTNKLNSISGQLARKASHYS